MNLNILQKKIYQIQNEYKNLLLKLLPEWKKNHAPEAMDEIVIFWVRRAKIIQQFLRTEIAEADSYFFTGVTYMDFDDGEYLPFLLMGEYHVFDDPLSKYSDMLKNMPEGQDYDYLCRLIGSTAEDNYKILENTYGSILILPISFLNLYHENKELFEIGQQAFLNLFENIESIDEYFDKCSTLNDILTNACSGIEQLVLFSESDDRSLPLAKRFEMALSTTEFMVDPNKADAYNFFVLVFGPIQQAVTIISMCVEYGCTPYIRYPVTLNYVLLLLGNMNDSELIAELRYKICIAHIVYANFEKERLQTVRSNDLLQQIQAYGFSDKLFESLAMHGINKKTFLTASLESVLKKELDDLYDYFRE